MRISPRHAPGRRRPGRGTLLLLVYLVLLALSHGIRSLRTDERAPDSGLERISVLEADGERRLDRSVTLAYVDSGSPSGPAGTPVLLIHGSPGRGGDFDSVLPALARRRRVLAPDLPGFGSSSRDVADYSNRAQARYLLQLLERLGLDRVHVVGYSMGGGVALRLYDLAPQRVRSVTLLSAIGVQELELFGDYRLNHLIHRAQLGAVWFAREGLPHMGALDDAFLGVPYARSFCDSDQRPLRSILRRFEPPMLILHGRGDFLVPPQAAREHHRLVPQSRLEMVEGSHFLLFRDGAGTARRIEGFLDRVDAGIEPGRTQAPPERASRAGEPFDPRSVPPYTGVALLLLMGVIAAATLISEDLTCIAVGFMVADGRIEFLPGVIAAGVGILIGDLLLFLAGRVLGRSVLRRAPFRWILSPDYLEIASRWLVRNGPAVIAISRFLPGTRLAAYFAAGTLRTNFWLFSVYFAVAAIVWTPLLVGLAVLIGARALDLLESFERMILPALVLIGLWMLVLIKVVFPLFTWRGRREFVGRWRRLRNWEFWPPWLFYPPVVLYVVWLGLRHRCPLLFTAANPAIPGGGFINESKAEILEGISADGDRVARTLLLPAGDDPERRLSIVREFMKEHGLSYPVVLKPDAGQRGSGVAIIRGEEALERYLAAARCDVLVQEHVGGAEFGIFYYRYPGDERGKILSITEKKLPVLVGDGRSTVDELILRDERAVCMSGRYREAQRERLWHVPADGEPLQLVELGTHCRGAIFLDGSRIAGEPLERAIDAISRQYRGFYFGRYDVRTPDVEQLRQGRGFKVIELNGVTSETTHIYDPGIGLLEAYRTLFEQWRIAFEIGRRNRERGTAPARLRELVRAILDYRLLARRHPR